MTGKQLFTSRKIASDVVLNFTYEGGMYVEVAQAGREATEVIYVADESAIPYTQNGLETKADAWIAEKGQAELAADVRENWYV